MRKLPKLSETYVDPRQYPSGVAYMDGQYLPMREATVSILDYGFLHSDATYDVAHVWNGAFFRLNDHLERFFESMAALYMAVPYSMDQMKEILHNCVALSGHKSAYIEFICTRGMSPKFSRDPRECQNKFMAFAVPFASVASEKQLKSGMHIAVTDMMRIPPQSVDARVKNYHWLDMIKALYQAYDIGADSAILIDINGDIAEGPGFNVFCIKDGIIKTPQSGVLQGITRQTVFDIFSLINMNCTQTTVTVEELKSADEVFITSTAGGIMPVTKIDNIPVGQGKVGTLTKHITEVYWQLHDIAPYREDVEYP